MDNPSAMTLLKSATSTMPSSGLSNLDSLAGKLSALNLSSSPDGRGSRFAIRKAAHTRRTPAGAEHAELDEEDGPARMAMVQRRKNFKVMERVRGRMLNIVEGLELHDGIFSEGEQHRIVDCVYDLQDQGRRGRLRDRTYSEPRKWMRGKGRCTIQFGCCYNYATDKNGNPPGIIRDEEVDPIPSLFKSMIRRMVEWEVLPPSCVPNSCIVNIYEKDDCIPPHIDHHDFIRPFCTASFITESNIVFGTELKILGPGEFAGSIAVSLPVGSVLIMSGNGADVAKHCVPAVAAKRISITFRRMDDSKLPYMYIPDPELQGLQPLRMRQPKNPSISEHSYSRPLQKAQGELRPRSQLTDQKVKLVIEGPPKNHLLNDFDFPPLGSSLGSAKGQIRKQGR